MAKFNVKVGPGVEASVRKKIEAQLQSDELLLEVGTIAKNDIVANIVAAKEPATGGSFANPNITPEWRKRKSRLATVNKAFDSASAGGSGKARLIFTGQWIQSITNRIGKMGDKKVIEIGPEGTHQPYTNLNGTKAGKPISNEKLGQYLKDQGRDWTGFPPKTKARLTTAVRNFLRRQLTTSKK